MREGATLVEVSGDELVDLLVAGAPEAPAATVVIASGRPSGEPTRVGSAVRRLATRPWVVLGVDGWRAGAGDALGLVDALPVGDDEIDAVLATVDRSPLASAALVTHLRGAPSSIEGGLVAESAVYSSLQAGPEFARWRASTPRRDRPPPTSPTVVVSREGDQLHIELARPDVRNALSARLRDEWLDALAVAEADPDLRVTITGQGPTFCAGGDLDEFGTFADPARAHVIRLERSIGAVLARLADRTTVVVHGSCAGSGVELPAFAGRVIARPDATFRLPELAMGLIPGAGGTVSLPARIGRHATALIALTGTPIDAPTALRLGLVDEIDLG